MVVSEWKSKRMEKRRTKRATPRARASTKDVLGFTKPGADRVPAKWREHYNALIELRNRLSNRRGELVRDAAEEQPSFSLHMADAGTDTFDRDFALSMASSEQNALYEVEQAINRIRDGTYGKCELTGKPIEPDRLKAVPWAKFSAEAEKQLEKEGTARRARLAPLENVIAKMSADEEHEAEEDTEG
jgi:RNA polymerase-binding transcription factor DksA